MKDGEETPFEKDMTRLVCHELPKARQNPARAAAMIELQARLLGMSISVVANGDARAADRLMQGIEQYIANEVTRDTPVLGKIFKE